MTNTEPETVAGRAWKATNDEMKAIATERRAEDWNVATMPAVHTSPVSRDTGDDPDRYGLVHIIPGNYVEEFERAYNRGSFPEYLAYRNQIEYAVFLLTEFIDPESETIILIASHYDARKAVGMVNTVTNTGDLLSIAKTLDGTELGRFYHEAPEPLLPETMAIDETAGTDTSV